MAKIGVFDLCSFFWTVAGTRKRGEDPYGLALQVLRYIRACAEKVGVEDVIFGADGPSGRSFRRSVCAEYKAGREAKDPEMVAELAALTTALLDAGFTVSTIAVGPVGDVDGTAEYFEGDDVVASFAVTILKDPTAEVCIGSNDWDLAPLLAFPKVRLFTTRGEERTAADVKREFGVEPLMLPQLKALAGDSDGYKPFPGLEKGKPGIGDKTAAAILEKFGSAEAAVKAACEGTHLASAFDGLPSRTVALLKSGGEAALKMGLTCARLRTDAPVPSEIGFGEWDEVEAALLGRQKAQQSEPRPEPVAPPVDAAKAFQGAAYAQLAGVPEPEAPFAASTVEGAVPDLVDEPCPDGKCEHKRGDHAGITGEDGCAVVGCPCMHDDNPNAGEPIAVTPLSIGRPIEAFRDNPVAAEDEERVVPRKRRSSRAAPSITVVQDFAIPDPDKVAAAFKEGVEKAAEKRVARGEPESDSPTPAEIEELARKRGWVPPEPKVFVLLTADEFIALTPLPSLFAAGLLTPPDAYAVNFAALLDALREGAFRPCDGVFIGSVPEACARGLFELSGVASCVMNGLEVLQSWRAFVDQRYLLPRFTDLAKYGGKLVRA